MAYLYKRGGVWWMKHYRNGRAYQESTKETTEVEARGA